MRASLAEFAASLRNLSAPSLVHTAEDARRRWRRRGPTGSSVQAVTAACCAVNAGAGAAREEGGGGGVRPFLLPGSGARGAAVRHGLATAKLMSAQTTALYSSPLGVQDGPSLYIAVAVFNSKQTIYERAVAARTARATVHAVGAAARCQERRGHADHLVAQTAG